MKDFQEFKKTLTKETLDKWNQEAYDAVEQKLGPVRESNPEAYFSSRPTMYSFHIPCSFLRPTTTGYMSKSGFPAFAVC